MTNLSWSSKELVTEVRGRVGLEQDWRAGDPVTGPEIHVVLPSVPKEGDTDIKGRGVKEKGLPITIKNKL
jgi:hypothetical protein